MPPLSKSDDVYVHLCLAILLWAFFFLIWDAFAIQKYTAHFVDIMGITWASWVGLG